jgi:hypothetical protein
MANLTTRFLYATAVIGLAVATVPAQDSGKMSASKVLQPQMSPDFTKPMGKLGDTPSKEWSATTLGASVNGKPNAASIKTVTGEIVDFSCYLEIGKHGEAHRGCAQKCFQNGQPIGLLTSTGTLYMLMEEEHDPRRDGMGIFRQAAIDHAGHVMEVTGTVSSVNGFNALYVTGFLKK